MLIDKTRKDKAFTLMKMGCSDKEIRALLWFGPATIKLIRKEYKQRKRLCVIKDLGK